MIEPNELDHTRAGYTESDLYQQLYPNGYQDGHAQYVQSDAYKLLEKHFAAYREEIEAKCPTSWRCTRCGAIYSHPGSFTPDAPAQAREEAHHLDEAHGIALQAWRTKFPMGYIDPADPFVETIRAALRSHQSPQAADERGPYPLCTRVATECHAHNGRYCMNGIQCLPLGLSASEWPAAPQPSPQGRMPH